VAFESHHKDATPNIFHGSTFAKHLQRASASAHTVTGPAVENLADLCNPQTRCLTGFTEKNNAN